MICRQTHNFAGTSHLHVFVHFFAVFNFKDFNDMKMSNCMIIFMENVNKQQKIFLSASKLECGPQEINSGEICLHYFDIFREFE